MFIAENWKTCLLKVNRILFLKKCVRKHSLLLQHYKIRRWKFDSPPPPSCSFSMYAKIIGLKNIHVWTWYLHRECALNKFNPSHEITKNTKKIFSFWQQCTSSRIILFWLQEVRPKSLIPTFSISPVFMRHLIPRKPPPTPADENPDSIKTPSPPVNSWLLEIRGVAILIKPNLPKKRRRRRGRGRQTQWSD